MNQTIGKLFQRKVNKFFFLLRENFPLKNIGNVSSDNAISGKRFFCFGGAGRI
jgi:hypothetical protein